ncbi:hypothetical protein CPB85DRAFT_1273425 [Mucidula mucida]|nr:hypothetical protein CPB85DRAFT_1290190 [Mucidula mucida]KAF8920875.1 hypothetical protein CPB85DRAFT_1273425 [Mucidula mucida]
MSTSILPESNEQYGTKDYWDRRYQARSMSFFASESDGGSFDWFKSYAEIAPLFRDLIPNKTWRILMLGCGNSTLSQDMYDDGYRNIVNVDYSAVVIDQMKQRHESTRPEMECKCSLGREFRD